MDKGITYDYINLYNASRSPSTVHVKNTRLRNYFRKYLMQKAISVFKWRKKISPLITPRLDWVVSIYAFLYIEYLKF